MKKKFRVKIDEELCKECKLCVLNCPVNILEIGRDINKKGYKSVICTDNEKCIGSTNCALMCLEGAIEIEEIE